DEVSEFACGPVNRYGCGHGPGHTAGQELSRAALHFQFSALYDDTAAARHALRPAPVDVAFVGRVADRVVHHRIVDAFFDFGIPDRDVGIRPDRDGALARVQAVHARMV